VIVDGWREVKVAMKGMISVQMPRNLFVGRKPDGELFAIL